MAIQYAQIFQETKSQFQDEQKRAESDFEKKYCNVCVAEKINTKIVNFGRKRLGKCM